MLTLLPLISMLVFICVCGRRQFGQIPKSLMKQTCWHERPSLRSDMLFGATPQLLCAEFYLESGSMESGIRGSRLLSSCETMNPAPGSARNLDSSFSHRFLLKERRGHPPIGVVACHSPLTFGPMFTRSKESKVLALFCHSMSYSSLPYNEPQVSCHVSCSLRLLFHTSLFPLLTFCAPDSSCAKNYESRAPWIPLCSVQSCLISSLLWGSS